MNFVNKNVGIWGFGIVGKSILNFLLNRNAKVEVFDKRELSTQEEESIKFVGANFTKNLDYFLEHNDYLIVSPGVDLREFDKYKNKFISELDVFYDHFKKPIIALTGTIGKTSSVHLISQLLHYKGLKIGLGGNVGYGMCDLINNQEELDLAVLEVSSFQLEYAQTFAPDIAIWTNFFSNHLDRHGTLEAYFDAKYKLIENQNHLQKAIVNFNLKDRIYKLNPNSAIYFFTTGEYGEMSYIRPNDAVFFVKNDKICLFKNNEVKEFLKVSDFPKDNFLENYFVAWIVAYLMSRELTREDLKLKVNLPPHRVEKFFSFKGVDFYNDSKSTVPEATLAAVNKLKDKNIILILGGISKGIDRSIFIQSLKKRIKLILTFGQEAEILTRLCLENEIDVIQCDDFENLISKIFAVSKSHDHVLFSPSGSSFDLFKNYEDRGNRFKEAVISFANKRV